MITKRFCFCLVIFLAAVVLGAAAADDDFPLHKGATEIGVFASGGSGTGKADSTQMINAGVRFGRILTSERGPGWLRGDFEYAFELLPFYYFMQDQPFCGNLACSSTLVKRQNVYAGGITPFVFKWNFTSHKHVVPFAAVEEGIVFATRNVPAGDTSTVNFTSGGAFGLQWLRANHTAFSVSGHATHISNASLGNLNPGMNTTVWLRLGYQWWR